MHHHRSATRFLRVATVVAVVAGGRVGADEGMWLFTAPPLERLRRDHGMEIPAGWLDHLQQASVRFSSGGSGSFVSADGLVLTNHHVGADAIHKLGTPDRDLLRDGFLAATPADELRCHDLELNVLVSIEDVTARVQAAVVPDASADAAAAARRAVMATIEKESLDKTGLRSDVVTLHQGGAYHLYRYRKYTDVRLVFAPEQAIAFFGGDADNFEFPRFNLDCALFRAYADGRPARVPHHLAWASRPVAAGDLVFVTGHPGHTDRANTVAELVSLRDRLLPLQMQAVNRLESLYGAYAARGPEERRQAQDDLFGMQNARKARLGVLAGLLDPRVFAGLRAREADLRPVVEAATRTEAAGGPPRASPYRRIEQAQADLDRILLRHRLLEVGQAFNSHFFTNARTILRAVTEQAKPDGERLREYRDSNRESLELQLFSDEPLYDEFETAKLTDSLTALTLALGADDPLVRAVLADQTPRERAAALVGGSNLGKRSESEEAQSPPPDRRRELYDGGAAAVAASRDPMLELARLVDDEARALRKVAEAVAEVKQQAHAEITQARFAREGTAMYPDATFTLRLAYGTVKSYEDGGRTIAPITTFAGLFARAQAKRDMPPFALPPRWAALRQALEADADFMATPFNFVSTADIIGGNSGSPVVNRNGELVGLIFDGNIHSLVLDVAYDDTKSRAIAVDARGILAALRQVYRADALVAELTAAAPAKAAAPAAWRPLFDGTATGNWKPTPFGGEGPVTVVDGALRIAAGASLSGVTWGGEFPRQGYELALQARRVAGDDFFCGLTFPVGADCCSLILGGWGGGVVGLSSIDGADASENGTTQYHEFARGRWYDVVVRVTSERITCTLDGEPAIDQPLQGRRVSVRHEVEASKPLGIATFATTGEVRDIRWRPLERAESRP
jgi:hypothetical protein